jgi:hypothetical protein
MHEMSFLHDDGAYLFQRFAQLAPMAQSTFPIQGYRCYGPYNYTFSQQSAGVGAPWHPGKRAHQLRAHSLAYFLLAILADAIDSIARVTCTSANVTMAMNWDEDELSDETVSRRRSSALSRWKALKSSQPQQVDINTSSSAHISRLTSISSPSMKDIVSALNLSSAGSVNTLELESFVTRSAPPELHPTALLYEYVYEYLRLSYQAPVPAVPARYNLSETNQQSLCYTDFEPRQADAPSIQRSSSNRPNTWTRNLSMFDVHGVEKSVQRGLDYLDRKYAHFSTGKGSRLDLQIDVKHAGHPIWICELQKGFLKYPASMTDLILGAQISIQYNTSASFNGSRKGMVAKEHRLGTSHNL